MMIGTLQMDGQIFRVIPEEEYQAWQRDRHAPATAVPVSKGPPVEIYTQQRIAEFLLNNATDVSDYRRVREDVLRMGLDPDSIDHEKPDGVE